MNGDAGGDLSEPPDRAAGAIVAEVGLDCVRPNHLNGGTHE